MPHYVPIHDFHLTIIKLWIKDLHMPHTKNSCYCKVKVILEDNMGFGCSKGRKNVNYSTEVLHSSIPSSSNKLGTKMTEADSFTNYSWIAAMVQIPFTFKSTFGSLHLEIMHLEILLPEVSLLFIFFQCFSVLSRMSWEEDEWMLQFKWVTLERERERSRNKQL